MAKLWKLTDSKGCTINNTQWGEGVTHEAVGNIKHGLCSNGFIHAYENPLIAVMMNMSHGAFSPAQMWEAEGEVLLREGQLKCGCRKLTTIRRVDMPKVSSVSKTRFAIGCVWLVCVGDIYSTWKEWALNWINGADRSYQSAHKLQMHIEDAIRSGHEWRNLHQTGAIRSVLNAVVYYPSEHVIGDTTSIVHTINTNIKYAPTLSGQPVDFVKVAEWAIGTGSLEELVETQKVKKVI